MAKSAVEGVPTDVLERIQKIFSLASKNPNEAEAAAAVAKGQELLERYNLSYEAVSGSELGSGARERVAVDGGAYQYQRDLWWAVAEINFCWYWNDRQYNYKQERDKYNEIRKWKYRHCLVGRRVNVAATRAMATYLEQAATRLTLEHTRGLNPTHTLGNWANSFRRGVVDRICCKLRERRRDAELTEAVKQAEERRTASEGSSTSTALTISVYHSSEMDANYDHEFGEGWSARRAAERATDARIRRMSQDEYTRWASEFPEEARDAADRKRQRSRRRGGGGRDDSNVDGSAYATGYAAGADISIDQQVDGSSRGRISHG